MSDLDRCCVCGSDEPGDPEGMAGCPLCLGCYCAKCAAYNRHHDLYTCKNCEDQLLPPPPGDADESRVASLRSMWTKIRPAGPVEYQTGWQIAKPDVIYLLDLADEALRARRAGAELASAAHEVIETIVFWTGGEPEPDSPVARLRDALADRERGR